MDQFEAKIQKYSRFSNEIIFSRCPFSRSNMHWVRALHFNWKVHRCPHFPQRTKSPQIIDQKPANGRTFDVCRKQNVCCYDGKHDDDVPSSNTQQTHIKRVHNEFLLQFHSIASCVCVHTTQRGNVLLPPSPFVFISAQTHTRLGDTRKPSMLHNAIPIGCRRLIPPKRGLSVAARCALHSAEP